MRQSEGSGGCGLHALMQEHTLPSRQKGIRKSSTIGLEENEGHQTYDGIEVSGRENNLETENANSKDASPKLVNALESTESVPKLVD